MSHRVVTDPSGVSWQVWAVHPTLREGVRTLAPEYQNGWLAFERVEERVGEPVEKRRLAPVPAGWETAPEAAVLALLADATPVAPRARKR